MLSGASIAFTMNKTVDVLLIGCMGGIGGPTYPIVHYLYVRQQ